MRDVSAHVVLRAGPGAVGPFDLFALLALFALVATPGCAPPAAKRSAEPPSGAVALAPGERLATPAADEGAAPPTAPPCRDGADCAGLGEVDDALREAGGGLGDLGALGGLTLGSAAPLPPSRGGTAGTDDETLLVTEEHCDTLGRKIAAIGLEQIGASGPAEERREAERIGESVASQCKRDKVGSTMGRAEYECLLRARAVTDILSCRGR